MAPRKSVGARVSKHQRRRVPVLHRAVVLVGEHGHRVQIGGDRWRSRTGRCTRHTVGSSSRATASLAPRSSSGIQAHIGLRGGCSRVARKKRSCRKASPLGQSRLVCNRWGVILVRDLVGADQEWKLAMLSDGWGSSQIARLGEMVDAAELPGFVAEHDGERAGLATFAERADGVEVVTIRSLVERKGVGRALMDRLRGYASRADAPRLWLMTTNDNVRAVNFYQRWGMDLVRVVHGGVDVSRALKPSIPSIGLGGVPIRHELEFELRL